MTDTTNRQDATPDGPGASTPTFRYSAEMAQEIELRWQARWADDGTFETPNPAGPLADPDAVAARGEKLFVLDMFPYPSGTGLHVGHPLGFIGTDVYSRFERMAGRNVLYTMGFDAFGLPAEQFAVQTGQHPAVTTDQNVANMRRQLRRLGLSHDLRRSVSTTDPDYYRWTQWIFSQIFESWYDHDQQRARPVAELIDELASGRRPAPDGRAWAQLDPREQRDLIDSHRLAYVSDAPVNWCPGLGTVVANEEVTADGRSDRGNFPVFKRNMRQWKMRITAYADRLIDDLELLDWTEAIKTMQRNWIGRSTGANVHFDSPAGTITVFTTRPDTLFGASFLVLAPEHPLVDALTTSQQAADVTDYRRIAGAKREVDRQDDAREKTGVPTGSFAVNPVTGDEIPIWIADYVLMGYGTGAIMAVPSGDQRDFEFARRFDLEIPAIQRPPDAWFERHGVEPTLDTAQWPDAFVGDAPYVNSANDTLDLNAVSEVTEGVRLTNEWLEQHGHGSATITYKLRDWLFSRQRYWGEPFPIVYDADGRPHALPDHMLPVVLPETDSFAPRTFDPDDEFSNPESPLDRLHDWVQVELDLGDGPQRYRRDTNVMPQWAGSCWYELRYLDPTNDEVFVDPDVERYWMGPRTDVRPDHPGGVDLYVGGVEHAVLHLLYARFWHKVLFDLGHVSTAEPFFKLVNQGLILGEDGQKMSKSRGNVVNPDDVLKEFGADAFRLYEMFMGPLQDTKPWNTRGVEGVYRFLGRVWRLFIDEQSEKEFELAETTAEEGVRGELLGKLKLSAAIREVDATPAQLKTLHACIKKVTEDLDGMRFNTAISAMMVFVNEAMTWETKPWTVLRDFLQLLAPFAPHIVEELWAKLHGSRITDRASIPSLTYSPWPAFDPALLLEDTLEIPVQVNGKLRDVIQVPADADKAALESAALAAEKVQPFIEGKTVKKIIVVPKKLVNIVVA
jgi:leucyl-tRNA synthetase